MIKSVGPLFVGIRLVSEKFLGLKLTQVTSEKIALIREIEDNLE